jgi:uncharacterized membrane protein
MWLVKGVFVGAGIFLVFSVFYLYWHIYSRIPKPDVGTASVDIRSIQLLTTQSPLYWTAFCLTVAAACVCMKLLQRT